MNRSLIILFFFCISTMSAELDQAKKYYSLRDYKNAYRIFHKLAVNGDAEAQVYVAIFLYKNFVTDPEALSPVEWLKKSCEQKNPTAMALLSLFYLEKKQYNAGMRLMEDAANLNSGLAQYYLGYFNLGYYGKKKNKKQAIEWLKKAVMNPDHIAKASAARLLGILYYHELKTSEDLKQSIKYFQIASDAKDSDASFILFEFFLQGEAEFQKNLEMAKKYFQRALKKRNPEALALAFYFAIKKGNLKHATDYFELTQKKEIDISATIKRYDHIVNDPSFEKMMGSFLINEKNQNSYQLVTFENSFSHGCSILPIEFYFDGSNERNRWCMGDRCVFQLTIIETPKNSAHEKWRIYLQNKFLVNKHNCKLILQKPFDITNKWKGEKILMNDELDSFSYWFLSNKNFFIFASLTARSHKNFSSISSQLDNFFIFLQLFSQRVSSP